MLSLLAYFPRILGDCDVDTIDRHYQRRDIIKDDLRPRGLLHLFLFMFDILCKGGRVSRWPGAEKGNFSFFQGVECAMSGVDEFFRVDWNGAGWKVQFCW